MPGLKLCSPTFSIPKSFNSACDSPCPGHRLSRMMQQAPQWQGESSADLETLPELCKPALAGTVGCEPGRRAAVGPGTIHEEDVASVWLRLHEFDSLHTDRQ